MRKALILGDANSIWVRDFAKNVIVNSNIDAYIYCKDRVKENFYDFYESNDIHLLENQCLGSLLYRIPKIRGLYERKKFIRLIKALEFDVAICIYVSPYRLKLLNCRALKDVAKYAVYIGSDILRVNERICLKMRKELSNSNIRVICDSMKLDDAYSHRVWRGKKHSDGVVYFGSNQFQFIDEVFRQGIRNAKENLGINPELITICVGYNSVKQQQHIKVINELDKLDEETKKRIIILLPLAYGNKNDYVEKIISAINGTNLNYKLMTSFLGPLEIAYLRVATDIFINSQTTDDLSASLLEFVHSGTIILNASWLDYPDLTVVGITFDSFDRFEEISDKLNTTIKNTIERKQIPLQKIHKFISWEACRQGWNSLFAIQ